MAPLEQQWVKVQQKTFTKWCASSAPRYVLVVVYCATPLTPRLQVEQQAQEPRGRDRRPDHRPL
jgi:hypothetical protein